MCPQGVCRIRKPAYAGNGCAIFPAFDTAQLGKKIRCSAADDLFRDSLGHLLDRFVLISVSASEASRLDSSHSARSPRLTMP